MKKMMHDTFKALFQEMRTNKNDDKVGTHNSLNIYILQYEIIIYLTLCCIHLAGQCTEGPTNVSLETKSHTQIEGFEPDIHGVTSSPKISEVSQSLCIQFHIFFRTI